MISIVRINPEPDFRVRKWISLTRGGRLLGQHQGLSPRNPVSKVGGLYVHFVNQHLASNSKFCNRDLGDPIHRFTIITKKATGQVLRLAGQRQVYAGKPVSVTSTDFGSALGQFWVSFGAVFLNLSRAWPDAGPGSFGFLFSHLGADLLKGSAYSYWHGIGHGDLLQELQQSKSLVKSA
ncbi:hypothetical protein VNO77_19783 [Canavalia gladiata]|uniref:Uncharacterized protein n=1 Tax=Canavalia gladiata TaxID=3824 RepID=A0AAN9LNF5_CANGL